MQIGETMKIKLNGITADMDLAFFEMTHQYAQACNYISEYIFSHDMNINSNLLSKKLYRTLRSEFGLKSQLAQSAIKTVTARYQTADTQLKKSPYRFSITESGRKKYYSFRRDMFWLQKPISSLPTVEKQNGGLVRKQRKEDGYMIEQIVAYNKKFVEEKGYEPYLTSKYPDKKLAILTCMDTRLIELLPAALGIRNGDAKVIKNAGGVITHPYGSVMRSLLVAIVELGVEEVMVIGHTDCGVQGMNGTELLEDLTKRGVKQEHIDIIRHSGVDLETWLGGFESVEQSVEDTVYALQNHPLMPKDVTIRGFIMNSETGELSAVK